LGIHAIHYPPKPKALKALPFPYGTYSADEHVHAQHHGIAISTLSISTQTSAFDIHQTDRKSVHTVSNENISLLAVRLPKLLLVN
jgi:hypothetical protein